MIRFAILALGSSLIAGCTMVPGSTAASSQSVPRSQSAPVASIASHAGDRQCLAQLGQAGVSFTPLADSYGENGCSSIGTVQLSALVSDRARMQVSNIGPVTCDVSNALAAWARFGADRAAQQLLGSGLRSIETFGSYSCRNVAGSSRRSAHATASAVDISGFVLNDGRRITVQNDWNGGSSAEKEFLRVVQRSACKRFGTVLGPEYNAAHRDHFHVEGVASGSASFCR